MTLRSSWLLHRRSISCGSEPRFCPPDNGGVEQQPRETHEKSMASDASAVCASHVIVQGSEVGSEPRHILNAPPPTTHNPTNE
jgi:hypothetical protein